MIRTTYPEYISSFHPHLTNNLCLFQELVAVIPSQQNLKGICISVLVIKVVLGLVSLSVFLMTPPDLGPRVHGVRMSLHNITSDSLQPNTLNATWVSGGSYFFMTIFVLYTLSLRNL